MLCKGQGLLFVNSLVCCERPLVGKAELKFFVEVLQIYNRANTLYVSRELPPHRWRHQKGRQVEHAGVSQVEHAGLRRNTCFKEGVEITVHLLLICCKRAVVQDLNHST